MGKNLQIDAELFTALVNYFLLENNDAYEACKKGIQDKLDRAVNRELYSKTHNNTLSAEDREKARQEYLDRKGIRQDFRWSEEYNNER